VSGKAARSSAYRRQALACCAGADGEYDMVCFAFGEKQVGQGQVPHALILKMHRELHHIFVI